MKILHINKLYYPWRGGVEKVAQDIAEGLEKDGSIESTVLACQPRGKWQIEDVGGVKVFKAASWGILMGMPISIGFFRLFRELVKEADLIFLHHPFPLGVLAYLMYGRGKRLVVWYHSDIVRQRITGFLFGSFLKKALKRADKIFVSSSGLAKSSRALRRFVDKTEVIPFGIDLEEFKLNNEVLTKAQKVRERFGEPLVLAVGRLTYYKGFPYLVKAMSGVDGRLLIIGEGKLKNKLDEIIKEGGLEDKVSILDHVDDLVPYYRAADVFVLPSIARSEAFGIVMAEAMACGVPVVSTKLDTGVAEVNIDGETGLVVEPKDKDALAEAINKILGDTDLKNTLSKGAEARAEGQFSKDRFIRQLALALKDLPQFKK